MSSLSAKKYKSHLYSCAGDAGNVYGDKFRETSHTPIDLSARVERSKINIKGCEICFGKIFNQTISIFNASTSYVEH